MSLQLLTIRRSAVCVGSPVTGEGVGLTTMGEDVVAGVAALVVVVEAATLAPAHVLWVESKQAPLQAW